MKKQDFFIEKVLFWISNVFINAKKLKKNSKIMPPVVTKHAFTTISIEFLVLINLAP